MISTPPMEIDNALLDPHEDEVVGGDETEIIERDAGETDDEGKSR